jgi:hypothetical protein
MEVVVRRQLAEPGGSGLLENHAAAVALFSPTTSSRFLVHFDISSYVRWRDGSTVERRRFGSPLGILRAAQGRKSSINREHNFCVSSPYRRYLGIEVAAFSPSTFQR